MKVPLADQAQVDPAKVRDYLLAPSHPIGRFKARFFMSLGYSSERPEELERDLHLHVQQHDAKEGDPSAYGAKYLVSGTLTGPSGRSAVVVSIWIILAEESRPRFITAYPGVDQ